MKKIKIISLLFFLSVKLNYAQSNLDYILKGGEILVNGLSFFKKQDNANTNKDSKIITSICIKNKMAEKITFKITSRTDDENTVKKEMVVQNDGKECVFDLPKGIYTYEILLANNDVYKKGEYKFEEETTITVKK